jgi:hypothetical protein
LCYTRAAQHEGREKKICGSYMLVIYITLHCDLHVRVVMSNMWQSTLKLSNRS